jgi:four helix bundle protein
MARPFQQYVVYQLAHEVVLDVYRATDAFPRQEMFGLTSQMRRSAASVPTNIAEGSALDGSREFRRFLGIALASATELEYQLILASDLGYLETSRSTSLQSRVNEVKRMLVTFRRRLRDQAAAPTPEGDPAEGQHLRSHEPLEARSQQLTAAPQEPTAQ